MSKPKEINYIIEAINQTHKKAVETAIDLVKLWETKEQIIAALERLKEVQL